MSRRKKFFSFFMVLVLILIEIVLPIKSAYAEAGIHNGTTTQNVEKLDRDYTKVRTKDNKYGKSLKSLLMPRVAFSWPKKPGSFSFSESYERETSEEFKSLFDFLTLPMKIGDFEQTGKVEKKEIVNEGGKLKIRWAYTTTIKGNHAKDVKSITNYFITTKDSGLGNPVITSIKKDGKEVRDQSKIKEKDNDLLKSVKQEADLQDGTYTYEIETEVTDVRDYYALDFHSEVVAELKKGSKVTYGGITYTLDKNTTLKAPSSTRTILPVRDTIFRDFRENTPYIKTSASGNKLVAGDFNSTKGITYVSSYMNTGNTKRSFSFDLNVDNTQTKSSGKLIYYKKAADGYVIESSEVIDTTNNTVTSKEIEPGNFVQLELKTEIKDEKNNHSLGEEVKLESLKRDLTIEKIWLDGAKTVDTSFEVKKETEQVTNHIEIKASDKRGTLQDVDKFKTGDLSSSKWKRIMYEITENPISGYYVAYSGSDLESMHWHFANAMDKTEYFKPETGKCHDYGITNIEPVNLNAYQYKDNWYGWGGELKGNIKIPAHAQEGDYFTLTLPKEYSLSKPVNKNVKWFDVQNSSGKVIAHAYLVAEREIKFILTKDANNNSSYEGEFFIGEDKTDTISRVNGKPLEREKRYFVGVLPNQAVFHDSRDYRAMTVTKTVEYKSTYNGVNVGTCDKTLHKNATVHYEDDRFERGKMRVNKQVIAEDEDSITWEVIYNAGGERYSRDARAYERLSDNVELYHGNNPSTFEKDIEIFQASGTKNGGYAGETLKKIYPTNEGGKFSVTVGGATKIWKQPAHNVNYNYELTFYTDNIRDNTMVVRLKTKKRHPGPGGYYYNNAYMFGPFLSFRGENETTYRYGSIYARGAAEPSKLHSISFKKVDSTKHPITKDNPAVFGIYKGEEQIRRESTNDDGVVSFTDLENGTYILKELIPPRGFQLDQTKHNITINADGSFTLDGKVYDNDYQPEIVNFKKSSITITKTEKESGERLKGAVFTLASEDGTYKRTIGQDLKVSEFYFGWLDSGLYTLTEDKVPDGYKPIKPIKLKITNDDSNGKAKVEILENGDNVNVKEDSLLLTIPNEKVKVEFTKENTLHEPLKGVEFELKEVGNTEDTNKIVKKNIVSGENGKFSITDLKLGTKYQLWETKPLMGYEKPEKAVSEFTINTNGEVKFSDGYTNTITNRISEIEIKIVKKDSIDPKVLLSGAIFEIYKEDSGGQKIQYIYHEGEKEVKEWTTKDGVVNIKIKGDGKFFVKEVKQPNGYLKPKNEFVFSFEIKDGQIIQDSKVITNNEFEVKNEKTMYFYLKKLEPSKDPIKKGVLKLEFKDIKNNTTKIVDVDLSKQTENGIKIDIPEDWVSGATYELTEYEAPVGFRKTLEKWTIQIDTQNRKVILKSKDGKEDKVLYTEESGKIETPNDITIINERENYRYPETGGVGTLPYYLLGISLMLFAASRFKYLRQKFD